MLQLRSSTAVRCFSSSAAATAPNWKEYRVRASGSGTHCAVATDDGYEVRSDIPRGVGGSGAAPQPVQLLLAALCGCEQATAQFVAFKSRPRIELGRIEFELHATRDQRGALEMPLHAAALPAPARLARIAGTATVHGTGATEAELEKLGEEVHRRCPVANMVALSGCELLVQWRKADEGGAAAAAAAAAAAGAAGTAGAGEAALEAAADGEGAAYAASAVAGQQRRGQAL